MIDLEFWSNLFEHDKNFFATYWTTQNILVPIAEKEIMYKGWIYEIDDKKYQMLCEIRTRLGYKEDYCGKCKTKLDAQLINARMITYLNGIKISIDENGKCVDESTIKKIRRAQNTP